MRFGSAGHRFVCLICQFVWLTDGIGIAGLNAQQNSVPATVQNQQNKPEGSTASSDTDSSDTPENEELGRQIQLLGNSEFRRRQQASREILARGLAAVPLLKRAASQESAQIRSAAALLLDQIYSSEFQIRLQRLKSDVVPSNATSLPEWDRFSQIVGDDAESLQLYLELLQSEQSLFNLQLFQPAQLPAALELRSSELALEFHGRTDEPFPAASYAALLLLGSNSNVRLIRATSSNISAGMADERLATLLRDGLQKEVFSQLINAWIARPGIAAERPLLFAMQHRFNSGAVVARRVISERSGRPDMLLAILALGALGDSADIAGIEKLFDVKTVLWPMRGAAAAKLQENGTVRNTDYSVQTCDAALVVAAHLRGIPFKQLGLDVRSSDQTLFVVDSLGFETPAARETAFAAYRAAVKELEASPAR